jgi:hypothetical protein
MIEQPLYAGTLLLSQWGFVAAFRRKRNVTQPSDVLSELIEP